MVCSHRLLEDRHAGGRRRQVAALASIVVAVLALPAGAGTLAVKDNLYGVKAMSASEAWAVGNFGSIYHTADAGKTWEARDSGTKVPLFGIDFADAEHGWIVGKSSTILATADGGKTWKPEKSVIPPEKGWAVGIDGLILRTRDAGQTWEVQHGALAIESLEELGFLETLKNPGLYDVRMAGQQGVVVGDTGNLMTTADGGETWTARELPEEERLVWLRGVSLLPGGSAGFAVGARGFMAAIDHGQIALPANGRRVAAGP